MRRLSPFAASAVSFLAAVFIAGLCLAAEPARTAKPASTHAWTVDEIVAKNIAAHGGEGKLKAVQSLRLTGKA